MFILKRLNKKISYNLKSSTFLHKLVTQKFLKYLVAPIKFTLKVLNLTQNKLIISPIIVFVKYILKYDNIIILRVSVLCFFISISEVLLLATLYIYFDKNSNIINFILNITVTHSCSLCILTVVCSEGQFYYDQECCACPVGTYQQDDTTVINCTHCSDGMSTLLRATKSVASCQSK